MLFTTIGATISVIAAHGIVSYGVGYFLFGTFQLPSTQVIIVNANIKVSHLAGKRS